MSKKKKISKHSDVSVFEAKVRILRGINGNVSFTPVNMIEIEVQTLYSDHSYIWIIFIDQKLI